MATTYPITNQKAQVLTRARRISPAPNATRHQWIVYLFVFQICCQLALLSSSIGAIRVPIRVGAFAISLAYLFISGKGRFKHPAAKALSAALFILIVSLAHPLLNSIPAGIAQIALNLAILAPVFWVPKFNTDARTLMKIVLLMWCFNTASASVGVLQVEFPGRFQPALSTTVQSMGAAVDGLYITTNDGSRVFRPMGLSDQPGGAAICAFYSVLFGLGLYLSHRNGVVKLLAGLSMAVGSTCLYLCQVRSLMIFAVLAMITVGVMLARRGKGLEVAQLSALVVCVIFVGLAWATSLAQGAVLDRLQSLTKDSATNTYYKSRGIFLENTLDVLLPQYPFGAGLGRWGMVNFYFGDHSGVEKESIYVEIQWTAWLLDGGVPLILAYSVALILALATAIRVAATRASSDLWLWGAVICAYDVAAVATTFNYPIFISQLGMDFWLINALLFAAWRSQKAKTGVLLTSG